MYAQVTGKVTYNGYGFNECVVGRTAAYVDQVDNHIAELTVRETLDFAARVQGAGFGESSKLIPKVNASTLLRCRSSILMRTLAWIEAVHFGGAL